MDIILVIVFGLSFLIRVVVPAKGNCESGMCKLEARVTWLEQNMLAADIKITEWIKQQYTIRDIGIQVTTCEQKITGLEERIQILEAEKKQKFAKPEALTMPISNNESNKPMSDAPTSNSEIEVLSRNLTSLIQRVDDMESKTIKNLTMDVSGLHRDLLLETSLIRSIETNFSSTMEHLQMLLDNSSTRSEKIEERLSVVETSITDNKNKQDMVLAYLELKILYIESAIESFSPCNNTWYQMHDFSLQALSANQKEIKNLKQDLSNVSYTLISLQEEISNISHEFLSATGAVSETLKNNNNFIQSQNETLTELLDAWKKIESMDAELRNFYDNAEARLFENLSVYMKVVDEKLENISFNVQHELEGLYTDFYQLRNFVQLNERNLNKNLSSMIEHLKTGEEQHKETIERLEEYFLSVIDDWKKVATAPELLEASPSNNEIGDELLLPNGDIEPEFYDDEKPGGFSCSFPKQSNVLMAIETPLGLSPLNIDQVDMATSGTKLKFGCENIGSSILVDSEDGEPIMGNFTLECINGYWKGGKVPSCITLMTESEIQGFYDISNEMVNMAALLPTITLVPNRLNMPNSFMETGPIGELVLYPGSSITLNCLFPMSISSQSSYPLWLINSSYPERPWQIKTSSFKSILRLISVTAENSGIYSCMAPNGKRNDIQLIVKDIQCPTLYSEPSSGLEIIHRPHPDIRSNSMSSQVFFRCRNGYKISGPSTAICTVYGSWSNPPPTCLKYNDLGHIAEKPDNLLETCFKFDLFRYPGLTVVPDRPYYTAGDRIYFECKGSLKLVGSMTAVCMRNKRWSIPSLPICADPLN